MRWRRFIIGTGCLVAIGAVTAMVWNPMAQRPVELRLVSVEPRGPGKAVTVEFRRSNSAFRFDQPPKLQTRIANQWQSPERFTELEDGLLFSRTNSERVVFTVPAQAEACRFSLEYRAGSSPYCRAYFFLDRHGVIKRFPNLSKQVLRGFRIKAEVRQIECELVLPFETIKTSRANCDSTPSHQST